MKQTYKLINLDTKVETICEKVVVDGFDYYVSDELPNNMDYYYAYVQAENKHKIGQRINPNNSGYNNCKKVIATNNSSLTDVPQIVDEVNKWTDENMVEFANFLKGDFEFYDDTKNDRILWQLAGTNQNYTTQELLQTFKDQQPKVLYYK